MALEIRRAAPALLLLLLTITGCSKPPEVPEKRYPLDGVVVALQPQAKDATIKAGPIGDWMGPMTMEYPIQPEAEFANLHAGDHIRGTVVVQGLNYYLTEIQINPQAK